MRSSWKRIIASLTTAAVLAAAAPAVPALAAGGAPDTVRSVRFRVSIDYSRLNQWLGNQKSPRPPLDLVVVPEVPGPVRLIELPTVPVRRVPAPKPAPIPAPKPAPIPAPKPAPIPAPAPEPPAPVPSPAPGLNALEQRMVDLVNQERAKAGLAPLKVDLTLVRLARQKSQDMADKNYFDHISPTYGSPFEMMRAAGVTYRYAGENLAGNTSVDGAHNALMNSQGHRANILKPEYTHFGIGIVEGGPYGLMITQMFIGK